VKFSGIRDAVSDEWSVEPRRTERRICAARQVRSGKQLGSGRPRADDGEGKLIVELAPPADGEVVVSQETAARFRAWLAG
jgi:hypothetical protein